MGLTTDQSWDYTPREFHALEQVHRNALMRWAVERADFRNAYFKHPTGNWTPGDFIGSPRTDSQAERDRADLLRAKVADSRNIARMQQSDFDDSGLPGWARMTKEEKAARGIQ